MNRKPQQTPAFFHKQAGFGTVKKSQSIFSSNQQALPKGMKYAVLLLLLILPLSVQLNAQEAALKQTVSTTAFWGDDSTISAGFDEELNLGLNNMEEYIAAPVDMLNLPSDVPEGGFPPYVCPSHSMTQEAPYAITGEVTLDEDSGAWRLRLYLWQTIDSRLIYSDEMSVYTKEECGQNIPGMLTWLFSWLKNDNNGSGGNNGSSGDGNNGSGNGSDGSDDLQTVTDTRSRILYFADTEPTKWLYLGLRMGGSIRILSGIPDSFLPDNSTQIVRYNNMHTAILIHSQLLSFLGIQVEGNYSFTVGDDSLEAMSMTFPFMLRASYRGGTMTAAVFGGGYLSVPIGEQPYELDGILGYTVGVLFGNKVGPGHLYLDIRWASDIGDSKKTIDDINSYGYHKHSVSISVGYEIGFFTK